MSKPKKGKAKPMTPEEDRAPAGGRAGSCEATGELGHRPCDAQGSARRTRDHDARPKAGADGSP